MTATSMFTRMTPSKMIAGTKVVMLDGSTPSPRRVLRREFVIRGLFLFPIYLPCFASIQWMYHALNVFRSDDHRGLWDDCAGTVVVERS